MNETDKPQKSEVALKEEKILELWNKNEIFKKTLEKEASNGNFVFYEGPPTANAKPALHHLVSRVFKDIIPRYKTMQGFYVRRKAGWDTHGLPVELQIEKKLELKSKKEIEVYGVEKFNKECKDSVFEYIGNWEKFTDRIGYWVDKNDAYYTFDTEYIESVWSILKTVNEKKLLYKDYKVLPWCPRCGTALSSHELAQGYQDDKDLSVTAKFMVLDSADGRFSQSLLKNPQTQKPSDSGIFILAWTTTPWTLPGNVALAVGNEIDYVKVKQNAVFLILAKERLSVLTGEYEVVDEFKGSDLVGLKYEPLYSYFSEKFQNKNPEAFAKSFQVYPADFVTTTDGTGVVHTAVMYGQDDFVLGTQLGLPKYHLVKEDGTFLEDMGFLSNRFVKDEEVAIDIIKDLAHRGLLFKKEKYEHSYPHCWRCNTPLIYYARDSWYIAMSKLRGELVAENEGINWEPEHIKEGRFGEWLREIKDWAISRERYWGTPLPVWVDEEGNYRVIGSIDELKKLSKKSGNKYLIMRHGEGEHNVQNVLSSRKDDPYHLTEKGKKEVSESAEFLRSKGITKIICSPFARTRETVEIIRSILGISPDKVSFDDRLTEHAMGVLNGKSVGDYHALINSDSDVYEKRPEGGENLLDIKKRTGEFLYETDKNNKNETILLITHEHTTWALESAALGLDKKSTLAFRDKEEFIKTAEVHNLEFVELPHNENYEIDLHKPYIDSIELTDENGKALKRVNEVLDVWFDSGAMPFAQDHYPFDFAQGKPFENKKLAYPADFISEAIDQTRGWFYTLHAIGVLMGKGKAFKNVICLGHILDKEGKKMSKSIGNILDPITLMDKYGVDALRLWMYTVNSPGDSKNFDEKTVDEIIKKVFNPILNIGVFYELYKDDTVSAHNNSQNVLDRWILSRLNEVVKDGTENLDKFKVFESARLIRDFVNDFSTWYVRRSRDRFKSEDLKEKNDALSTTSFVMKELSKYMAPFTPFFAEQVYETVKTTGDVESVHLSNWPSGGEIDENLLSQMQKVRATVTSALELRQKAGHKVRQPLASLTILENFSEELLDIIADEVNVKEVKFEAGVIRLDTELTNELKNEGVARDIIRGIQDARKKENLSPSDTISLVICTTEKIQSVINSHLEMIKSPTQVQSILYSESTQTYAVEIEENSTSLSIVK
ncbi:MAG: isoleucine--tRNA ligase [Candidatus Zambryskibacteria bacterium]|nr:isoleucine--tRNA ligase [Candidatus Zambryskibacteria bacterium]